MSLRGSSPVDAVKAYYHRRIEKLHDPIPSVSTICVQGHRYRCTPQHVQQRKAIGDQWYIGTGGGIAHLQPDPDDTSIDLDEDYGNAGTVFLGWDFDRRSSGQIQLYSLGEATFDDGQSSAGYIAGDVSLLYRFFDSRDRAPRGTVFGASVYGRFGLGLLERDSDLPLSNDTPVYFGAGGGIEAYFTHNLGVRLEALYQEADAATATLSIVG